MSLKTIRAEDADGLLYEFLPPALIGGNIVESDRVRIVDVPGDIDADPPIEEVFHFEMQVTTTRPLTADEVIKWNVNVLKADVAAAKDRAVRSIDWANDKSTKLNTFAGLSEAETRPTDNPTALAYIQFLYDNIPTWARWHSKHMKGAADAIFGTGATDASDQEPV